MTVPAANSDELPQVAASSPSHPSDVAATTIHDPASVRSKRLYSNWTMSSVGLEFGLGVIIGLLFGRWLDAKLGTDPWMMILFLVFGFAAGVRALLRVLAKADREARDGI